MLAREGIAPVVVERASAVGAGWRRHYDRLRLHTVRWMSDLPGMPLPRRYGKWVRRDDLVRYLEDYAFSQVPEIMLDTEVERVDRGADGRFTVSTSRGEITAGVVVLATGYNRMPHVPEWPGRETFGGQLLHSSEYRNPEPFAGRSVLVVGAGNSGAEIATDLAEGGAAQVLLSVRTPPNVVPRAVLGLPSQTMGLVMRQLPTAVDDLLIGVTKRIVFGDLTRFGLPAPTRGAYTQVVRDGVVPVLDVGFASALKRGLIEVIPAIARFTKAQAVLVDDRRVRPSAVIAATGYRFALEPLVGHLGVLDERGRPQTRPDMRAQGVAGLYFVGFHQPITGNLREMGIEARIVARAVARADSYSPSSSLLDLPRAVLGATIGRALRAGAEAPNGGAPAPAAATDRRPPAAPR